MIVVSSPSAARGECARKNAPPAWSRMAVCGVRGALGRRADYKIVCRLQIQRRSKPAMSLPQALLNNRTACALVSLFCLVESVWSWASITRGVRHREDLINIFVFVFVIFIAVSIAYRSSFWADRVVFGAVAGAFALVVVRALSLTPAAMFAVAVAHAFMWTIAGFVSLIVLARGFRVSTQK
jgi:hypothetical protein